MTDNPCRNLTKAQTGAFAFIAIGLTPNCSKATLQKLLDRGLIVRRKKSTASGDYFVRRPILNQWIRWAESGSDARSHRQ